MIELALIAHLAAAPAIASIVSGRLYAERAPQGEARPRIVVRLQAGSARHYHAGGASGLVEADIEITCHAGTYVAARDLYEAVRDAIDGFRGTWDGVEINRAVLTPPAGASAAPSQGDDVGQPAVRATAEVFYRETLPALGS